MSKRLFSMIAVSMIAVSLFAGCSAGAVENQAVGSLQSAQSADETESEKGTDHAAMDGISSEMTDLETIDDNEPGGKILVVYYSATGNTERVANVIAEAAGADLFELEPVESYTDADLDWTDESSRVTREHDNREQREVELVSTTIDDWDAVSKVYIGYPMWWGEAAWPVNSFIEANDFTGKTVIPFCTSSSSGLGESSELLAELAGTGDWQKGMRFSSGFSEEDVVAWVEDIGL